MCLCMYRSAAQRGSRIECNFVLLWAVGSSSVCLETVPGQCLVVITPLGGVLRTIATTAMVELAIAHPTTTERSEATPGPGAMPASTLIIGLTQNAEPRGPTAVLAPGRWLLPLRYTYSRRYWLRPSSSARPARCAGHPALSPGDRPWVYVSQRGARPSAIMGVRVGGPGAARSGGLGLPVARRS